ncbi:efflux RND transporter periplasmic adaptor subunit [Sulfurimonas microaerophilic]|uniref:efflux RND transporter periplasmic adaptor subunit n=1 Tax=Sulfurimonas microaerophilic TaxID=3058392 RepID=UPI0027152507|nr:efflux RND transporter periplasmic adaptor subunit [Sulfurimonas sp. hsl 1-7]
MNKIFIGLVGLAMSLSAGEVYATFNVLAQKSASLAFDAGGIVERVNVDISDTVKKGEVLASLENRDAKANLESAKVVYKYAQKDYERQQKVKNLIDASEFDAYALKYESAKAKLDYTQSLFDKTYLRAPFDGVIFFKEIEVGDTVNGMMLKTVFKIQSKHERKLVLEFDQKYYKDVKVGNKFQYKIDGEDTVYTGVISKIYPLANKNNRKVQAEVKAKDLMVGLFGDGTIITQSK